MTAAAAMSSPSRKCPGSRSPLWRGRRQGLARQCIRHRRAWWKSRQREDAPSNLIISGRYILQPEIFAEIAEQKPGAGGEIQITDAMIRLMARPEFQGREIRGHHL